MSSMGSPRWIFTNATSAITRNYFRDPASSSHSAFAIPEDDSSVVRTILAVDEAAQSLTFAGDVPEGWYGRSMKANFDRLIDGATGAAQNSIVHVSEHNPDLAILISCAGRRMVLRQRTEEELEGVRHVVGPAPALTGFYSYGEISPLTPDAKCVLHNQTMTITSFKELR